MTRVVALDTETTSLYVDEGARMISIGMVELIDGQSTGRTYHAIFNPQRDSHPLALQAHNMTPEFLQQYPPFNGDAALEIFKFLGESPVITLSRDTERHGKEFIFDREHVNNEMDLIGMPRPLCTWINVKTWAVELYGEKEARLNALLDRYGVSRQERDDKGHGALLDAQLLAAVYPRLKADYEAFKNPHPAASAVSQPPRPCY